MSGSASRLVISQPEAALYIQVPSIGDDSRGPNHRERFVSKRDPRGGAPLGNRSALSFIRNSHVSRSSKNAAGAVAFAGRSSKMYWPHLLEFVAAGVTEVLQQINRAVDDHFAQFDEALVRLQIGVQDFSDNIVGALDHRP